MKKLYTTLVLFLMLPLMACSTDETDLYQQVAPSVVQISVLDTNSTGSGFFIGENLIVTNQHVINRGNHIQIRLYNNNRMYRARLVGSTALDLALLKIVPADWNRLVKTHGVPPALIWRTQSLPQPGERVWSLGNPVLINKVFTTGIVGKSYENIFNIKLMLVADLTVLPGNSGGPLVDSHGRVVGISTAVYNPSGIGNYLSLAIPAAIAQRAVMQIATGQTVTVNQICMALDLVTNDQHLRLRSVDADGPADVAGMQPGDKLIAYRTSQSGPVFKLYDVNDLLWMLHSTAPEAVLWIQIERNNHRQWLQVQTIVKEIDTVIAAPIHKMLGWLSNINQTKPKNSCHTHS